LRQSLPSRYNHAFPSTHLAPASYTLPRGLALDGRGAYWRNFWVMQLSAAEAPCRK